MIVWNKILRLFVSSTSSQVQKCYFIYIMQVKLLEWMKLWLDLRLWLNKLFLQLDCVNLLLFQRNSLVKFYLNKWPRVAIICLMDEIPCYIFPLIDRWSTLVQRVELEEWLYKDQMSFESALLIVLIMNDINSFNYPSHLYRFYSKIIT